MENAVLFEDYYYATLDFINPDAETTGSQDKPISMPFSWGLAPNDEVIVQNVIATHRWGAHRLIVSGGTAHNTKLCKTPCKSSHITLKIEDNMYYPNSWNYRVLIRKRHSPHNVVAIMRGMWAQKRFTDCIVVCAGEEVSCHRAVLSHMSPVFDRMLSSGMRETTEQRIEIGDAKFSTVMSMLNFAYTGEIHDEIDGFVDLLSLADQYDVKPLVVACGEKALDCITRENVVRITRAFRRFTDQPEDNPMWRQLLDRVRDDRELLTAVMKGC